MEKEILELVTEVKSKLDGFKEKADNLVNRDEYLKLATEHNEAVAKLAKLLDEKGELSKTSDEALEIAKANAKAVEKLLSKKEVKSKGKVTFKELGEHFVDSEEFKNYGEKEFKGRSGKVAFKDVSLSGNYTGYANAPATLTFETDVVRRYPYQTRPLRVRDVIPSTPIELPFVISEEIIDFVNTINVNSENGTLAELEFTVDPKTYNKKRIGGHIKISKDMIQSRSFVVSEIERQLPLMYYYLEDNQLLNGDGTGNNVLGLFKNTSTRDLSSLSNTYIATDFASVADFGNGQVLITFTNDHNLFDNYKLTIAASTNYNGTYDISVHSRKKIVITATYVAEATAAWTGTADSSFVDLVDNANTSDVISAAMRQLRQGYFVPSAVFINPTSSFDMERAKGTDGHYLGNVTRDTSGIIRVDGVPVVETDVVPVGKVYIADVQNAARIYDYRELTLEMADDVTYKLNNQVALIIEAHVIMANFNPLMTMIVDIAGVKADLETP